MSEAFNPADLLSGLAANPEMLKNAIQMASALASSGALSGLFGGGGNAAPPSGEPTANAPTNSVPANSGVGNSSPAGGASGFADLLAGLMGAGNTSAGGASQANGQSEKPDATAVAAQQSGGHGQKRPPTPCHQDRVRLLQAVCPFLPEEKREKVQFLIKLLELLSTAEGMGLGKLF